MRVELLRHWKNYSPGKVFEDMPEGAANVLIRRGVARETTPAAKPKAAGKPKRQPCEAAQI
jgi:hypothetical protein